MFMNHDQLRETFVFFFFYSFSLVLFDSVSSLVSIYIFALLVRALCAPTAASFFSVIKTPFGAFRTIFPMDRLAGFRISNKAPQTTRSCAATRSPLMYSLPHAARARLQTRFMPSPKPQLQRSHRVAGPARLPHRYQSNLVFIGRIYPSLSEKEPKIRQLSAPPCVKSRILSITSFRRRSPCIGCKDTNKSPPSLKLTWLGSRSVELTASVHSIRRPLQLFDLNQGSKLQTQSIRTRDLDSPAMLCVSLLGLASCS